MTDAEIQEEITKQIRDKLALLATKLARRPNTTVL
jgi:hypothetical protein